MLILGTFLELGSRGIEFGDFEGFKGSREHRESRQPRCFDANSGVISCGEPHARTLTASSLMILCLVGDPLYTAPATPVNGAVCSREVMYVSNMPLKCCVMVGTICGHRVRLGKSIVGA